MNNTKMIEIIHLISSELLQEDFESFTKTFQAKIECVVYQIEDIVERSE